MPKPKLADETKTYNLLMPVIDWNILAKIAHLQTLKQNIHISVGALIRDAYQAVYFEELE